MARVDVDFVGMLTATVMASGTAPAGVTCGLDIIFAGHEARNQSCQFPNMRVMMIGYSLMVTAALCGFFSTPVWCVIIIAAALTLTSFSKHWALAYRYSELGAAKVFGTSVLMLLSNNFVFCLISYGFGRLATALFP